VTTIIGYVMCCVAVFVLFKKWQLSQQVNASLSWPQTTGEITASALSEESSGTYDSPNRTYRANIRYRYKVGSRLLSGDKICVGGQLQLSLRGKAEAYLRQYPQGKSVTVYYNPRNPSDAVLETREETSWLYLLIGVVFAIVGFGFLTG
jgi:hypothetical protein